MKVFNDFFKQIKWWEYLFMGCFIVAVLVCGIVFHSGPIVILSSFFGMTAVFFIAKGKVIGNFLAIVQAALYIVMSYYNKFYGEILVCLVVTIPMYIFTIVSWMKNSNKKDKVVKVNKSLSKLEWGLFFGCFACSSVGIYFMLRAFNTANLIISTFSVLTCAMAGYLVLRRCEYNFVFYILNNIICVCLWMFVIIKEKNVVYIPTIVQYGTFLCLNAFGIFNWAKIKRIQMMRKKVLKRKQERLVMDTDYMKENR